MHIKLNKEMKQILDFIAMGMTYKKIAEKLMYSERTVKRRAKILFNLYKVHNKEDLRLEIMAERLGCRA